MKRFAWLLLLLLGGCEFVDDAQRVPTVRVNHPWHNEPYLVPRNDPVLQYFCPRCDGFYWRPPVASPPFYDWCPSCGTVSHVNPREYVTPEPYELRPKPPNGFLIRMPIGNWEPEPGSKLYGRDRHPRPTPNPVYVPPRPYYPAPYPNRVPTPFPVPQPYPVPTPIYVPQPAPYRPEPPHEPHHPRPDPHHVEPHPMPHPSPAPAPMPAPWMPDHPHHPHH